MVIAFHKPYGVLCQFTADAGNAASTLKDYIDVPNVYAAGRLDQDSEGLLVLTDEGELQHRLTDPKFAHERTYLVQVERVPDESALEQLRRGVTIQGYKTRPARARSLSEEPAVGRRTPPVRFRKTVPTAWLELTITEGKNRQVRKMTAAVGHPTLRLLRIAIGALMLGDLRAGQWRELSPFEISLLFAK